MTNSTPICNLAELPDDSARGFSVNHAGKILEGFVVHKNGNVFGYVNRCPHTGVNLEWKPDHFLDIACQYIQCSTHGAKFRIEDGYCIYGPCQGDSLRPVTISVSEGKVWYLD